MDSRHGQRAELIEADRELLLRLRRIPTAGPLETGSGGPPPQLWDSPWAYAKAAAELGFIPVHHAPVHHAGIPGFLDDQPSLVLRLEPPMPREAVETSNVAENS
jgi:hypothetical protein